MPDKEPGAREHPLQFLAVDLVIDKDLAADLPRRLIDETLAIPRRPFAHHRRLLGIWPNYAPLRRDVTMPRGPVGNWRAPCDPAAKGLARRARRRPPRQRYPGRR